MRSMDAARRERGEWRVARDCGCGVRRARQCFVREETRGWGRWERWTTEVELALCTSEVRTELRRDVVCE
jgi:hypothetical protein